MAVVSRLRTPLLRSSREIVQLSEPLLEHPELLAQFRSRLDRLLALGPEDIDEVRVIIAELPKDLRREAEKENTLKCQLAL